MSADEFVTLVNKITEWGKKNGINSWDQLINYVLDDPFRLFELYEYCGADIYNSVRDESGIIINLASK